MGKKDKDQPKVTQSQHYESPKPGIVKEVRTAYDPATGLPAASVEYKVANPEAGPS